MANIKTPFSALVALLFCGLLFMCSVDAPSGKEYSLKEHKDISYYEKTEFDSELTKLNLIIPEGAENPPVLMWVGGGAWAYVNRHKEMELCRKIAKQGVLVISVGHRLSPALIFEPKNPEGIKHPEHVKDLAQAFKWVYDNADNYSYSTENIFVGGFSSGAHLAALLAADKRYLEGLGLSTKNINAIIPVGGGYDIPHYALAMKKEDSTLTENHINVVFGKTHAEHLDASPTTYIKDFNTPMLMLSENYTYPFTVIFEQASKENGKENYQVLNCHNESHASLWTKLSKDEDCIYRNYIVDYIFSQKK